MAYTDLAIKIHASSILDLNIEGKEDVKGTIGFEANEQSVPNKSSQGLDLAFWRIPQSMQFEGEYHPTMPYALKLKKNEESDYDGLFSVEDLRSSPKSQWQVKARLSPLKMQGQDSIIHEAFRLKMNVEAKKHRSLAKSIYVNDFEEDDNGVRYSPEIIIDDKDTGIARTDFGLGKAIQACCFQILFYRIGCWSCCRG